jgi:hypothetical protein
MKIGIIGAGHIGGNLARRFTALGHDVRIANSRGPETLAAISEETGATAVAVEDTVPDADVVIVTIPEKNVPSLPRNLFANAREGLVVIDTNNYYPARDGHIADIESGMTESRWVSNQVGRPVVKAFNSLYAAHLLERGQAPGSPGRLALPVAGDDADERAVVIGLMDELGFDGVDAGGLDDSWRQQPGTPVYGRDLPAEGVRRALQEASSERQPEFRAPATT